MQEAHIKFVKMLYQDSIWLHGLLSQCKATTSHEAIMLDRLIRGTRPKGDYIRSRVPPLPEGPLS